MTQQRTALLVAALGATVLPFVPFIRLGAQGYQLLAFIERVWLLRDLSSIESSWVYPPSLALVGAAFIVVCAIVPGRWLRRLLPVICGLLVVTAALVMRVVASSATASPDVGVWLFFGVTALSLGAWLVPLAPRPSAD